MGISRSIASNLAVAIAGEELQLLVLVLPGLLLLDRPRRVGGMLSSPGVPRPGGRRERERLGSDSLDFERGIREQWSGAKAV